MVEQQNENNGDGFLTPELKEQIIMVVETELQKIKEDPDYLLDWKEARKTIKVD